jgi:hypothetical protein
MRRKVSNLIGDQHDAADRSVKHRITVGLLRELPRMAAVGVPAYEAARRVGCDAIWLRGYARDHRLPFVPMQNRGMPAWMMPEAARQAEAALRGTMARLERWTCH